MDESLRGFGYGENREALLYAIRQLQPGLCTHVFWAEKERVLDFLGAHCEGARSLLCGTHSATSDEKPVPDMAWMEVVWEGQAVEVVFPVGPSERTTLCLGRDPAFLERFARAAEEFADAPSGRCLIFDGCWDDAPELDAEIARVSWNDVVLPEAVLRDLRAAVEGFFAHKEVVRRFGFAWKRGILMVGPPGTGKTMVCKAVASATPQFPFLYVRSFSGHNPIPVVFARARQLAPCILAFEDIDGLLDGSNRTMFLNEMDGFASNDGLLVIASSNHPGKIDEALLKRPSRFDRVFHLGLPEAPERQMFCERLLGRSSLAEHIAPDLDVPALAEKVAAKTDGFTPAYLKEAFTAAALHCAQEGFESLDARFAEAVLSQVDELRAHLKKVKNPDALAEMRSGDDAIGFRR